MNIKQLLPNIQENIPLAPHTTFKIGGPSRYFFVAKSSKDIIRAVEAAQKCSLPFFILGGGSNVLVSDKGFEGMVIKIKNDPFDKTQGHPERSRTDEKFKIKNYNLKFKNIKIIGCEAGTPLGLVVSKVAETGLTGLEWAAGIPGTVGGAVRGNAGAFGRKMEDIVKTVEVLETPASKSKISIRAVGSTSQIGQNPKSKINPKSKAPNSKFKIKKFLNKDCKFGYRDSIFKQNPNLIILSAELQLKKGNKEEIKNKMKEYFDYRKEKQPLEYPSAGSVFKNFQFFPFGGILDRVGTIFNFQLLCKRFPNLEQFRKKGDIPAAYLIDQCGLKGKRIGGAMISEKHPNFIINIGKARAEDVIILISIAKQKVRNKFGILLEEEIQYLE